MEREKNKEILANRRQMAIILAGSPSDDEHCSKIEAIFDRLDILYERRYGSAHKTPEHVARMIGEYLEKQEEYQFTIITVAGLSNALSGHVKGLVYGAEPPIEVIAAPPFNELDVMSSLRMPYGVPVACFFDPKNAALHAAEGFSQNNPELSKKYVALLSEISKKVIDADNEIHVESR